MVYTNNDLTVGKKELEEAMGPAFLERQVPHHLPDCLAQINGLAGDIAIEPGTGKSRGGI